MLKGWRTIAFNVLSILAVVVAYLDASDLKTILPDHWGAYAALGIGVANVILRTVTTTTVGQKS